MLAKEVKPATACREATTTWTPLKSEITQQQ
jgi:hypothetical protein